MAGRDIDRLHDELEQLFDDLWRLPRFSGLRRGFRPEVDVFQTGDPPELTVVVDLAGVDLEEVQVALSDRTLLIAGERRRPHPDCPRSYQQLEIAYGRFERRVALGEDVDVETAQATYERGLLTIVLPVVAKRIGSVRATITVRTRR